MPAAAGSRRTLNTLLVWVVAVVTWLALCSLLLGRGPSVDLAGAAQTATTVSPTEGSAPPPETTTSAVTVTSAEPTTSVETVPSGEESTSDAGDEVQVDEVESTTTIVEEEEVEEPTTTTAVRSTTTIASATTKPPAPGTTATSAAVPSSAASSNGGATTGSGATSSGDDSQDVLRIVMATLVVVGLLIGLLTWRYWCFSDPKRGLAPARARIPLSRSPALATGVGTAAPGIDGAPTELVASATMAPTAAWSAGQHDDVGLRPAPGPYDHDQTAVFTDDPTDPGGWPLPDRQPVGSE